MPSPAEIIIFSTIHSYTDTHAPNPPDHYPKLKEWFLKTAQSHWATEGVKQTKEHQASTKPEAVVPIPAKDAPVVQKLQEGCEMFIPDQGQDM